MDNFNSLGTTNKLLLCIVVPLVLYLLKILAFIFVPLFGALLVGLMFLPFLRQLSKKNVPRWLSMIIVSGIIFSLVFCLFILLRISIQEILSVDRSFWIKFEDNLNQVLIPVMDFMAIDQIPEQTNFDVFIHSETIVDAMQKHLGKFINYANSSITMLLMAIFFLLLLLAGSINVQKLMENAIFKKRIPSMRVFVVMEKSIVKFIVVKFIVSVATGFTFGLMCVLFDVKFPVFWGLLAFGMNFIQMLGSIVVTIALSIFAMGQLDPGTSLLLFSLSLISLQLLLGSVVEPIFMGKTFSINTVTILVMLLLWGYLWNVAGMILAVPITVIVKIILDHFIKTQRLAKLMS
ncbi:MAG: AI-2E family transporter [Bacteroidales bacterium]|jgi:AI-2 transport protein TqsA|nr:AI-2E family transporter [Bacteroidales bacterium]